MGREVIIYCGNDNKEFERFVSPLQQRLLNQHPELKEEDVQVYKISRCPDEKDPSEEEKALFASLGPNDRITIVAHCAPNSPTANRMVHYSQLAKYLEKRLDKNKIYDPKNDKSIKISLVMCNAGKGRSNNKQSFAAQFHHSLGKLGLNTQLTARSYVSNLSQDKTPESGKRTINTVDLIIYTIAKKAAQILFKIKESKLIKKLSRAKKTDDFFDSSLIDKEDQLYLKYHKHQAPGSKSIFKWEKGEQKIHDAYKDKFKRIMSAFCEKHHDEIANILTKDEISLLQDRLTNDSASATAILKIMTSVKNKLSPEAQEELQPIIAFGNRVISSKAKDQVISTGNNISDSPDPDITKALKKLIDPMNNVIEELKKNDELSEFVKVAEQVRNMIKLKSNDKLIFGKNNTYNERVAKSFTSLLKAVSKMDHDTLHKSALSFNKDIMQGGFFRKQRFTGNKLASNIQGISLALKTAKQEGGNPLMMFGNFVRKIKSGTRYQVQMDKNTKDVIEKIHKAIKDVSIKKPRT